jgi:hypothetical protein
MTSPDPFFNADDDFTAEARLDGGQAITVFFDLAYAESLGVSSSGPAATCLSDDVAAAQVGSVLTVKGADYRVAAIEPDGTGVTVLRLHTV